MGCDIHFYVERKVDGAWVTADTWVDEYGEGLDVPFEKSFYHDRNYDLFAILADVRNGHGFAGTYTGEGFEPIHPPRGVPEDACPEYKAQVEAYGVDGHSHSWATAAELMAYDWTRMTTKSGVVTLAQWAVWRDQGKPREWSGGVSGPNIKHVTPQEMEAAWVAVRDRLGLPPQRYPSSHLRGDYFTTQDDPEGVARGMKDILESESPRTRVSWTIPYYEAGRNFLGTVLPRLWRLGSADDVRCCYYFDN